MVEESCRKYLLAIKRGHNNYLPLEWNLTKYYNQENLYTLEGIDSFTKKMRRIDLINEILNQNLVDGSDHFRGFSIIYYSNGKNREVKEGPIFQEDINVLDEDEFIFFIMDNINDKKALSFIYNMCSIKSTETKLEEFKFVLKYIDTFKSRGNNGIYGALSLFKDLSYETKRKILLRTSARVRKVSINEEESFNY